jgi:hypothetical protein
MDFYVAHGRLGVKTFGIAVLEASAPGLSAGMSDVGGLNDAAKDLPGP